MGGEESQIVLPLRGSGLPLKRERGMTPLRITCKKVIIQGNCVHMGGGGGGPD